MAGNKCAYYLCGKSSRSNPGLKKFSFPVDDTERNQIWIRNSGNAKLLELDSVSLKKKFICQFHFDAKDIMGKNLVKTAVPIKYLVDVSQQNERSTTSSGLSRIVINQSTAWKNALGFTGSHRYADITPEQCYSRIRICGLHFDDCMFTNESKSRIHRDAVPTLIPLAASTNSGNFGADNNSFIISERSNDAIIDDTCAQVEKKVLEAAMGIASTNPIFLSPIGLEATKGMASTNPIFSSPIGLEDTKGPLSKCRVCWEANSHNVLFSVTTIWSPESSQTIKEILLFCVPALSIQDDNYLCKTCLSQLKISHDFIKRCLQTENILMQESTQANRELNTEEDYSRELGSSAQDELKMEISFEYPELLSNSNGDELEEDCKPLNLNYFNENELDQNISQETCNESQAITKEVATQSTLTDNQDNNLVAETPSDNVDKDLNDPSIEPSIIPSEVDTPKYILPPVLVDILDFAPINVRGITIKKNMSAEHRLGLLQEGVNIVDMSSDSSKRKRMIYLGRDILYFPMKCDKCKLPFNTRCEYEDHMLRHRKGKLKLTGELILLCTMCPGKFICDREYRTHCLQFHGISRPHACSRCSKKFYTHKALKHHQEVFQEASGRSKTCVVKCKRCEREYTSEKQWQQHETDVFDAPCCDYLKCKVCSKKFTKEGFKAHCEEHPNFACEYCGKSLPSSGSLKSHVKNVHDAKHGICHECGKVLKGARMLQQHIDSVHGNNRYMCDKCPRVFTYKFYLTKHISKMHSGERKKNIACGKCGKMFADKHNLHVHMQLVHLHQTRYKCPTCGEGFVRNDYLRRHMNFHEKYMQYTCSICKKSFSAESRLTTHQEIGHDENGKPLYVAKKTKTKKRVAKYKRQKYASSNSETCDPCLITNTEDNWRYITGCKVVGSISLQGNEKPCVCNICNKVLACPSTLRLHYKSHLKIREFRCDKCEITLPKYGAYRNHMKKHENPNFEFSCNICHAYKSSREELQAHKQQVHKNMKYKCKYCSAKFGRKHLLFSHESIKHPEEYTKREELYKVLANQRAVEAPENAWVSKTNKGVKLGPFLDDVDQVFDKLAQENEKVREIVKVPRDSTSAEETLNVLSEAPQTGEEDKALEV